MMGNVTRTISVQEVRTQTSGQTFRVVRFKDEEQKSTEAAVLQSAAEAWQAAL